MDETPQLIRLPNHIGLVPWPWTSFASVNLQDSHRPSLIRPKDDDSGTSWQDPGREKFLSEVGRGSSISTGV